MPVDTVTPVTPWSPGKVFWIFFYLIEVIVSVVFAIAGFLDSDPVFLVFVGFAVYFAWRIENKWVEYTTGVRYLLWKRY